MNKMADFGLTESTIQEQGYKQLTGKKLKERLYDKTIRGEYYIGRIFISYLDNDGNVEGENDLGRHVFGKISINMNDNTLTTKWDGYWDNWTGRAYDVNPQNPTSDIKISIL